jgi:threonine aldolase
MYIDLRSDTVTRPTPEMREAMSAADVGDDVYEEDPTVKRLESRVAALFGKESALFFPSGTMSNLTAVMAWSPSRGGEVILGENSHMFLFEQAGMVQFGGISPRTVRNLSDGTMPLDLIASAIRDDDIHEPATRLICIENTHNVCGGTVLPMSYMRMLNVLAESRQIPIHMDGARVWNALEAGDISPLEMGSLVDSLSVCLSKGLGAPAGSLLVGPADFIKRARRIRKALGGGMRQVGILAAAGLAALDDFDAGILKDDHWRAQKLADAIRHLAELHLSLFHLAIFHLREPVQTNILFVECCSKKTSSEQVSAMFRKRGILVSAWSSHLIRLVVHRDIGDVEIESVCNAFWEIATILSG